MTILDSKFLVAKEKRETMSSLVAPQKTRRIVSLAKVKSMGQTRKFVRYIKWQLAFCFVMEVRVRVRICFSLETPTPTSGSVSFLFLGAELKKMGNSNDFSFRRVDKK